VHELRHRCERCRASNVPPLTRQVTYRSVVAINVHHWSLHTACPNVLAGKFPCFVGLTNFDGGTGFALRCFSLPSLLHSGLAMRFSSRLCYRCPCRATAGQTAITATGLAAVRANGALYKQLTWDHTTTALAQRPIVATAFLPLIHGRFRYELPAV
jgi:hypothetical protein